MARKHMGWTAQKLVGRSFEAMCARQLLSIETCSSRMPLIHGLIAAVLAVTGVRWEHVGSG